MKATIEKTYQLRFNKKFLKDLTKIPLPYRTKIRTCVEKLAIDPRPEGFKKLKGHSSLFRLRCGVYRIVYSIEDSKLLVLIIEVGHRKEI